MPDVELEKRRLQREIARGRQRIDHRLGMPKFAFPAWGVLSGTGGGRPGMLLLAAFAGGLLSGLGIKPSRDWARWALRLWRLVRTGMGAKHGP